MSRALTSIVAVAVLAACADFPVVAPGGDPNVAGATAALGAASDRPAGGTCTLVSRTILPAEPGQPANVRHLHSEYVCQLEHLGRTTAIAEETITITATGPIIANTTIYTAANGDQLFVSFNGAGTPPDQNGLVSVSGTETVTGGTGRFTGASGSLSRTGSVSTVTVAGEFEMSGTLIY
jgi:hypothetical protein